MGRNYFLYLAVTLTLVIFIGSLISVKAVNSVPVHFSDKIIHFVAYFLLALSWFFTYNVKQRLLKYYLVIAMFVFVYGIIIEACQMLFTNERQADIYDILANLTGVLAALILFNAFFKKKN